MIEITETSLITQINDVSRYGMGYDLVAEGIETDKLLQKVNAAGFNLSQGYLFGKPTRNRT